MLLGLLLTEVTSMTDAPVFIDSQDYNLDILQSKPVELPRNPTSSNRNAMCTLHLGCWMSDSAIEIQV